MRIPAALFAAFTQQAYGSRFDIQGRGYNCANGGEKEWEWVNDGKMREKLAAQKITSAAW